jgi:hypothetical protein
MLQSRLLAIWGSVPEKIELPYLGSYQLQYDSVHSALLTISTTLLIFDLVFYFTHFYAFVLDFTTVNHLLLYVILGFLLYSFRNIHQGSQSDLLYSGTVN